MKLNIVCTVYRNLFLIALLFVLAPVTNTFAGGHINRSSDSELPPPPSLNSGDTTFCGQGYLIVRNAAGSQFQWKKLGSGSNYNDIGTDNDSLLVTASGTYFCEVTSSGNNKFNTDTIQVTINAVPDVQIGVQPSNSICNGEDVTLTATGATTYVWSPAATLNISTGTTVIATPSVNTTYKVVGTGTNGCKDSTTVTIAVKNKPIASFTYSPSNGCPQKKRKLSFTSTSSANGSGTPLTYSWNFGDPSSGNNNTSNDQNPSHSFIGNGFNTVGSFIVTLTVTGDNGCKSSTSKTITLGTFPDATLLDSIADVNGTTPFKICESSAINELVVKNISSTQSINTNYTIIWGDGTQWTGTSFSSLSHIYSDKGYFTLVFRVESGGCIDESEYEVYIGSNPAIGLSTTGATTGLCVPNTKPFKIDTAVTSANPPGTLYTITYNDGSPDSAFFHPPPISFNHNFSKSSCGAIGGDFKNTFFVKIIASNPCGSTRASVQPITTISPPDANFNMLPTVCVNTSVSIQNASLNGIVVKESTPGSSNFVCDSLSDPFWTITSVSGTPNAWTVSPVSALGNASQLNPGNQSFSASFSEPGLYSVRLLVRNNATSPAACRLDTTVKLICVQAPPTPKFSLTKRNFCAPDIVNMTDLSSNLPTCAIIDYLWTVNKLSSSCTGDSTSNFSFVAGSGPNSTNPALRFNNEGVYEIVLTLTGKCNPVSYRDTIIVKQKPRFNINATAPVCLGNSVNPTANFLACGGTISSYSWSFPGGNPSASTSASPGSISYTAAGTKNFTLSAVNECGTTTGKDSLRINPIPAISGATKLCVGDNQTLSGSVAPSSTSPWISSNSGIVTVNSGGVMTGISFDTTNGVNITYTDINNCSNFIKAFVYPLPTADISGNTTICSGSSTLITFSGTPNSTVLYSVNNGPSQSVKLDATGNYILNTGSLNATATYTLISVSTGGTPNCTKSLSATITVTVRGVPNFIVPAATTICSNSSTTISLSGGTPNTTLYYHINSGTTQAVSYDALGNASISTGTLTSPTTYYFDSIVYNTAPACRRVLTSSILISIKDLPIAAISGVDTICINTSRNISFSGTPNATVTYKINNGPNQTIILDNTGNASISTGSLNVTTTYSLVSVSSGGSPNCSQSLTGSVEVVVSPLPLISGPGLLCKGSTIQLSGTAPPKLPNPWSASNSNISIDGNGLVKGLVFGQAIVTYVNRYGCNNIFNVSIDSLPIITGVGVSPTNCTQANGSITISGLIVGNNYILQYTKSGSSPAAPISISNAAATNYVVNNLTAGTYNIYVKNNNGCQSDSIKVELNVPQRPAMPNYIGTNAPICSGDTLKLFANSPESGVTYNWFSNKGYTSSDQNPVIPRASSFIHSATYTVNVNKNGCTSKDTSIVVVVDSTPVKPTIKTNSPLCEDSTLELSAVTATQGLGNLGWIWTGPSSFSGNDDSVKRFGMKLVDAGFYVVKVTLGNCSSKDSVRVIVNSTPRIQIDTFINPATCGGLEGKIKIKTLAPGNYVVSFKKNGIAQPAQTLSPVSGVITISNLDAGDYSDIKVISSDGCPSKPVGPVNLKDPNPPGTPNSNNDTTVCSGNNVTFSVKNPVSTINYIWNGPGLSSANVNSTSVTINTTIPAQSAGIYSVYADSAGCKSKPDTMILTVLQTPSKPLVNGPVYYCQFDIASPLTAVASSGSTLRWYDSAMKLLSGAPTPQTNVVRTYKYYVTQRNITDTCQSQKDSISVIIKPKPQITGYKRNPINCATATGFIILKGLNPGSYQVKYDTSGVPVVRSISTLNDSLIVDNLVAQTYSNIHVLLSGCPSDTINQFILSDPNPPDTPKLQSNSPVCSGNTINVSVNNTVTGGVYSWSGPKGPVSGASGPSISVINSTKADSGLYKVTVTLNNCKSIAGEINVIVNQTPPAPGVTTPIYYCKGDIAQALTANTLDGNHFLRWYTAASGGVGSAIAPVPSTQNTGTSTYYVSQISSDSCEGPRTPIGVIIREIPEIADVNKTVCSGEKISITPSGPGVPANTQYYWYIPIVSNTDSLKDASADSAQLSFHDTLTNVSDFVQTALYTVYPVTNYIPTLACPGKPFKIDVTVNPSPKIRFSIPNDTICSGDQMKQVTLISPTPGAVISWNSPSVTGISGNNPSGSNTIPVQTLDNSTVNPLVVKYIAQAVNSGGFSCPGIPSTYEVTVAPTPDIKNKMISICSGSPFEHDPALSQPPNRVPVNTKYTWTISADNSNIKGQNGQTQKLSVISDTLTNTSNIPQKIVYTVQSYSGDLLGCPGNPFTIEVTVNPTPVILPLYDTICSGNSFDLKPTNTFPDTLVPVNTTYSWIAPVAPAYIRGLASGNSQVSIAGLLYNDSYAPYTVTYKVIPVSGDQGSCIGDTFDVLITVNPLASISNNPLNQELCDSNNSVAVTWTSFSAGATYSWKLVKSGSITGYTGDGAGDTLPSMFLGNNLHYPDTLRYAVSSTANECAAPATNYDIIVNPDSKASYTYTKDTACWPFNINNTVINNISTFWVNDPTVPNDRFEWYAIDGGGNGNLIGNSRSFPGYTIPGPGDSILIKLVVRNKFKCKDDSVSHWFFTSPKPLAVFSLSPGNGCGPLTVSFTNKTALKDSFEYFWNFGNQQFSTLADPPPMVFLPDTVRFIDTTYYVVLRVNNECDTSYATIPVTVNSKPKARFLPSSSKICSNTKIKLKNTSLGFGNTYEWHFNDGSPVVYKNDSSDVEHVYNTSTIRTFVDTLIAINQCGRDTTTYPILVTPITIKPNFLVTADTKVGCAAHTVTLQNLSTGGTRFEWYFAFPDTSVKQVTTANTGTISHTYTRAGRYLIKLRALNECSDTTDFDSVVVLRTPKPDFSFNGNSICVGQPVSFLNQTDTANLYSWHFGNGDTSKSASPAYSFSTPGRYTIKLVAGLMDLSGVQCKDSIERIVVIVDSLPGSFSVSADTGYCTPFSVTFTNLTASSGTPVWDFGDGSPLQYGNSVTHTYDSAGKFIAHMAVTDPAGCKYGMKKEIVIAGPYGALNYDGDLVCGNKAVRFEAVVFNTDSIQWDFGDGNTVTTKSRIVFHSYSVPGQFTPSIILISPSVNGTCRISLPGTKVIKVDYLNAGFSHAATNYCDSTIVQLQDTATAYSGIQSWEWTLGNGSILNNQNPAVPYYSTNNYPVKQVIQSNWGCTDTAEAIIPVVVNASPSAAILALNKACEGDTVKFISNINSQDSVNLIKWEGVAGYYGKEIILPFSTPGTYNLKLIAGTIYGCFDTADASIVIHPLPELIAKESKTICQGQSTQLLAVTNATNVRWTPSSSLSCSDCINPVATPSSSTSYVAVATSNQGCRSADTVVIMVKLPIDIDVSGNDTICIGESTSLLVTGSGAVRYAWSPATSISCTDCTNPVVNPDASTRYMVVGYDSKNNTELCFTDTAYVEVTVGHYPIVTLPADTLIQTGSVLRPDPDITYGNGIVFEPIRTFTWSPLINIDSANFEIPKITVRNNICYKLDVENIYGCKSSDEFCIKVFCENSQVFIPNAFTPTQSTNRRFWVRTKGINKIKTFRVFNRWGEVVFEKNNFTPLDGIGIQNPPDDQGWDGKIRGVWANPDVYVYIVEVVCDNEVPFFYKGNVTLIR